MIGSVESRWWFVVYTIVNISIYQDTTPFWSVERAQEMGNHGTTPPP